MAGGPSLERPNGAVTTFLILTRKRAHAGKLVMISAASTVIKNSIQTKKST
jgi:hypothetical protein